MSRPVSLIFPFLVAWAVCVVAADARASDLTVRGRVSETIELNDNYGLSAGPKSGVLGSYSAASLSALYRTPATRFSLNGDIVYRKYFGPDSANLSETTSDGVNMRFERTGNSLGDRDYVTASYRRSDAALVQRDDFGFSTVNVKGDFITLSGEVGSSRRLTNRDVVTATLGMVHSYYSPSSSSTTPFTTYRANTGWSHSATQTIDLTAQTGFGFSTYDNSAGTQVVANRTTGGARIRLTDTLSIGGNAGVSILKTTQDTTGPVVIVPDFTGPFFTPVFTPPPAVAGTTIGPVYDVNLNYRPMKSTSVSVSFSQTVSQGSLGSIARTTQLTMNGSYALNSVSSLSFTAGTSLIEPPAGGTGTKVFNASLSYRYQLARDWNATATYIYRQAESSQSTAQTGTSASSNAVLFVIAKDFVLTP